MGKLVVTIGVGDQQGRQFEDLECQGRREGVPLRRRIVYHRHDEKGLNWEPGGIRSGAGVRSSGVSQESTGSSDTWEAAFCRLCLRR